MTGVNADDFCPRWIDARPKVGLTRSKSITLPGVLIAHPSLLSGKCRGVTAIRYISLLGKGSKKTLPEAQWTQGIESLT